MVGQFTTFGRPQAARTIVRRVAEPEQPYQRTLVHVDIRVVCGHVSPAASRRTAGLPGVLDADGQRQPDRGLQPEAPRRAKHTAVEPTQAQT